MSATDMLSLSDQLVDAVCRLSDTSWKKTSDSHYSICLTLEPFAHLEFTDRDVKLLINKSYFEGRNPNHTSQHRRTNFNIADPSFDPQMIADILLREKREILSRGIKLSRRQLG